MKKLWIDNSTWVQVDNEGAPSSVTTTRSNFDAVMDDVSDHFGRHVHVGEFRRVGSTNSWRAQVNDDIEQA